MTSLEISSGPKARFHLLNKWELEEPLIANICGKAIDCSCVIKRVRALFIKEDGNIFVPKFCRATVHKSYIKKKGDYITHACIVHDSCKKVVRFQNMPASFKHAKIVLRERNLIKEKSYSIKHKVLSEKQLRDRARHMEFVKNFIGPRRRAGRPKKHQTESYK